MTLIILKYEISDSINDFFDTLSSNFLLSLLFLPARISKTSLLIDIFSNSIEEIESVNVTSTFSDHLPQFIYLYQNESISVKN